MSARPQWGTPEWWTRWAGLCATAMVFAMLLAVIVSWLRPLWWVGLGALLGFLVCAWNARRQRRGGGDSEGGATGVARAPALLPIRTSDASAEDPWPANVRGLRDYPEAYQEVVAAHTTDQMSTAEVTAWAEAHYEQWRTPAPDLDTACELLCFHEASHAVLAHHCGATVLEIRLRSTLGAGGLTRSAWPMSVSRTDRVWAQLLTDLAGWVSDRARESCEPTSHMDWALIHEHLMVLLALGETPTGVAVELSSDALLGAATATVSTVLEERSDTVARIAETLKARGPDTTLGPRQLAALLEPATIETRS